MPEIRYTGAPTVTPEEARRTAAIPGYQLGFPEVRLTRAGEEAGSEVARAMRVVGDTTGMLGRSIDSLGKTMEGAGNELWNRAVGLKQLELETKVNKAAVAWEQDQVKRDNEWEKLRGEQVGSAALDAKQKTDEDARLKVRNALGSPWEQRLFDQQTTRPYLQAIRRAGEHSANELKKTAGLTVESQLSTIGARVDASKEDVDREAALDEGRAKIANEWRYINGATSDMVTAKQNDWVSKHLLASAQRMSDEGDARHALEFLESKRADIEKSDPTGYAKTVENVTKERGNQTANAIADKAAQPGMFEHPDRGRAQMLEELDRAARAGNWTDNQRINVERLANERYDAKIAIQARDNAANHKDARNEIYKALYGKQPGQEGPADSPEKLKAAVKPEVWGQMSEEEKREFEKAALHNAFEVPPTPANQMVWHKWHGVAMRDPKQLVDQEAQTPGWIQQLDIPYNQREMLTNELYRAQAQGMKALGDFRVNQAWNYGTDHNLITDQLAKKDNPDADILRSYIATQLEVWTANNKGKVPSGDDYKTIINSALSNQKEDASRLPFGYWHYQRERATYEQGTDYTTQQFRDYETWYKNTRPGAGDNEIRNEYTKAYIIKKLSDEEQKKLKARATPITPAAPVPGVIPGATVAPGG